MTSSIGNVVNDSIFDTSTNQTIQTGGSICEIEFNNCSFKNGFDDGVSLHGLNTIITINDCYFEGNQQAINSIESGICYVNDCNFVSNGQDLAAYTDSQIIARRCHFRGLLWGDSSVNMELYNSTMYSGETRIDTTGGIIVRDCKYLGTSFIQSYQTDITRADIQRCYFEMSTQIKVLSSGGVTRYNLEYSTFKHVGATNTYCVAVSGTGVPVINNCNFIGNANIGRGIQALGPVTVTNTIFQNLDMCVNPNGAVVTFNYCNTYANNRINSNTNGGSLVNINNITTDPLFTDIANLDFRLQSGSGSIGTGATLTNAVGIESADWVSSIPSVTTKEQGTNWNRGAYVN